MIRVIYSRVPNNRLPPPTPPIVNFSSFLHPEQLYAIFTIVHHKEKEIVQSNTITINYVNTKHMLSL